jgi:hypothetical protein
MVIKKMFKKKKKKVKNDKFSLVILLSLFKNIS